MRIDPGDGLAHFLSVRPDVLDGRCTGGAGDTGEAFDAAEATGDGTGHDIVPLLTSPDLQHDATLDRRSR